ncbi:transposase zinc-ribbon domain protein [Acidithrix ferrooxidans]|uniref:Transposase zinc-ribbon domain protein n=1 Tax=Acidithrix ferrooxidans TaxID=1280514 RepID=A0A0D8HEV4_9ACTN|nr:transposase zinc-ribbon domain protein [Acidithrix ferrooxidans]
MDISGFMVRFASEEACEDHLIKLRWKEGFRCPKCDSDQFTLVRANHFKKCSISSSTFSM